MQLKGSESVAAMRALVSGLSWCNVGLLPGLAGPSVSFMACWGHRNVSVARQQRGCVAEGAVHRWIDEPSDSGDPLQASPQPYRPLPGGGLGSMDVGTAFPTGCEGGNNGDASVMPTAVVLWAAGVLPEAGVAVKTMLNSMGRFGRSNVTVPVTMQLRSVDAATREQEEVLWVRLCQMLQLVDTSRMGMEGLDFDSEFGSHDGYRPSRSLGGNAPELGTWSSTVCGHLGRNAMLAPVRTSVALRDRSRGQSTGGAASFGAALAGTAGIGWSGTAAYVGAAPLLRNVCASDVAEGSAGW